MPWPECLEGPLECQRCTACMYWKNEETFPLFFSDSAFLANGNVYCNSVQREFELKKSSWVLWVEGGKRKGRTRSSEREFEKWVFFEVFGECWVAIVHACSSCGMSSEEISGWQILASLVANTCLQGDHKEIWEVCLCNNVVNHPDWGRQWEPGAEVLFPGAKAGWTNRLLYIFKSNYILFLKSDFFLIGQPRLWSKCAINQFSLF